MQGRWPPLGLSVYHIIPYGLTMLKQSLMEPRQAILFVALRAWPIGLESDTDSFELLFFSKIIIYVHVHTHIQNMISFRDFLVDSRTPFYL